MKASLRGILTLAALLLMTVSAERLPAAGSTGLNRFDRDVGALLARMTLEEKIGQMAQLNSERGEALGALRAAIAAGRVGSVLNEVDVEVVNELQRIAVEKSRLGIPLLIGRDVIHGFRTVLPIPLGQAATFNPELVRRGARMAALEAAASGVNWTFAPMIDVTRDPRWGRIAESLGEDPYLHSVLGAAMVRGFQGDDLADPGSIAACAKHFAGYGASESGRDYNPALIPENELRNVYLRPFHAAVDAGAATLMTSFSEVDGVPATGSRFPLQQVLRDEWGFAGFVVSDWASVEQLAVHGYTADDRQSALAAVRAGVNMEMATRTYADHLAALVADSMVPAARLDELVRGILRVKFALNLFAEPYTDATAFPAAGNADNLAIARDMARQSVVLLENRNGTLPLQKDRLRSLTVVGPLADDPYEQLGTWIVDGDPAISRTPLAGIREVVGDAVEVRFAKALETSRSRATEGFEAALGAARESDAVVVFLGEESILSGEAHSRADIGLPGAQAELVKRLHETGRPVIAVVLAGRPLTLAGILDHIDALLFAWHPGTMAGPALADLLFGVESPSGKLPATFPRMVGQVPIYYAHKHTGKPATAETFQHIDDIPVRMPQSSSGFVSSHLDAGFTPQYAFGYGLSYARFGYSDLQLSARSIAPGESLTASVQIANEGPVAAEEVVQLYLRDLVGSVTRPVKELKGFQRVRLAPGESRRVSFTVGPDALAFYGAEMKFAAESGDFHLWIGGSSRADLQAAFTLRGAEDE
jgi:beta-glucosidase